MTLMKFSKVLNKSNKRKFDGKKRDKNPLKFAVSEQYGF